MIKNRNSVSIFSLHRKKVAGVLLFVMLIEMISPLTALALTGGPSQPEVQSFEPVSTSEMVDPFSGDFTYNIPLLKVGDYPINISYKSGVTMDQEASWVGLGWNINAGVINRNMRGIPDDFAGDEIVKELSLKVNRTYGVNAGANLELLGNDNLNIGLGFTLGVIFNNYTGFTVNQGVNLSVSAGGSAGLNAGLGLNSSSDEGLTISPKIGFSAKAKDADKGVGVSVGTAFNSRQGLKQLTINAEVVKDVKKKDAKGKEHVKQNQTASTFASASFDIGMPTYTPSIPMSMQNFSMTGSFDVGGELYTVFGIGNIGGFYSAQSILEKEEKSGAYGYMNSDLALNKNDVVLDFNREKDGSFSNTTPSLPLTNFTYDIFSVNGQGIGGSYRPFRSDIGYVHDPPTITTSDGGSIGGELGAGGLFHGGVDISITTVTGTSGKWWSQNTARQFMNFKKKAVNSLYEPYYLKEANERSVDSDPDFYASIGEAAPQRFQMHNVGENTYLDPFYIDHNGAVLPMTLVNYRKKREKRNQNITILKKYELEELALSQQTGLYPNMKDHHIGEITSTTVDGARYIYGIPAYNTIQHETTFAVGENINGSVSGNPGDIKSGLVPYIPGMDNSRHSNNKGLDNYYSNTITPAYAHSFLLTAVLSPEYVDADNVEGPSSGDFGNYTKFEYKKACSNYKWRTPYELKQASYNEGLKSDKKDDKASYIYGEKELWYLDKIRTKDYVAEFIVEDRDDGVGVTDKNGGINAVAGNFQKRLKVIKLYNAREYPSGEPIQQVFFTYSYELCKGIPNSVNFGSGTNDGKLTLKGIYFKYRSSGRAIFSPYTFEYCKQFENNYAYDITGYDRWGNFKKNNIQTNPDLLNKLYNNEYPYVNQGDQQMADAYASAWSLSKINLPSGGKIEVEYESDDYAYVQHKRAGQMFKIVAVSSNANLPAISSDPEIRTINEGKNYLFFKLDPNELNINEYFVGVNKLYFRFLMEIKNGKYDFVSGYAEIVSKGISSNAAYGYVQIKEVSINDSGQETYSPISKAAIQFGRIHNPTLVWGTNSAMMGSSQSLGLDLLNALISSNIAKNIVEAINGPNKTLYDSPYKCGQKFISDKSWVRLSNPTKKKFGGGSRVKKVKISDNWNSMTSTAEATSDYGQEYFYTLANNSSSGVASYEPQLGGDENPWKQPDFYEISKTLAPDDEFYMETPYGESFFPSPSVGYSRVLVRNLLPSVNVVNKTGYTVHEFYTTYDFPTITRMTIPKPERKKNKALSISSLFNIVSFDFMTASQGFSIEVNDMNGKPKATRVYQEGVSDPITSIEYNYKSEPFLASSRKLINKATVIKPDGVIQQDVNYGIFFDMVGDMRESYSVTEGVTTAGNLDGFMAALFPITVPMAWPTFSKDETRFRSATTTKVVQRFGILESTVAKDLGSVVTTKNLAYDSETGEPLLTETTTNFNDKVYSLKIPAYYYYDRMGQAYKNVGFETELESISGFAAMNNADKYFVQGDEVAIYTNPIERAWVQTVSTNGVVLINKTGLSASFPLKKVKIIRSGRRNMPNTEMMNITMLDNPINKIQHNIYEKVTAAGAVEFSDNWNTYCDCFSTTGMVYDESMNEFVKLMKGNFVPNKKFSYLTGRTQSKYNNNTNVRRDGVFTSFTPFYKLSGGKWVKDYSNWTYTSEVTENSPNGMELENRDALGRYSAATYGYAQTLPTAVAANAKYKEVGYDGFEDYDYSPCADNHFKFNPVAAANIVDTESHTGRKSIKVENGNPLTMTKQISECNNNFCGMEIQRNTPYTQGPVTLTVFNIVGGTAPYSFIYNVIRGQANCTLVNSGNAIQIGSTATWMIELSVTDINGCQFTSTIMN